MYMGRYERFGDYTVDILDEHTCAIVQYHGDERELTVPEEICGYRVVRIGLFVDEDGYHGHGVWFGPFDDTPVQVLKLPDSVVDIDTESLGAHNLRTIYLNKKFMSENMNLMDPKSFLRRIGIADVAGDNVYGTSFHMALRAVLIFR